MTVPTDPYGVAQLRPDGRGVLAGDVAPSRDSRTGPSRMPAPSLAQLTYAKELMIVILLAVAFPWLLGRVLSNPGSVLRGVLPAK
jgi:hypothetical protein